MGIDFECTDVFYANYLSRDYDIVINQGGTSSSKTYSIMQLLFMKAVAENGVIITVTGESIPNLKKGAYRDAEAIVGNSEVLQQHIRFWNKTDRVIYFKNGSLMEFTSNLNEQSAKNGKRNYLFVNEANGVAWPIFWQLAKRTVTNNITGKNTALNGGIVYIDYNPSAPFWAHENLIGTQPEGNDLGARVKLIISDHRHNRFLSADEHYKIENIKDPERWRVYARGYTGNLEGLIYPNWRQIPDSSFPDVADFFGGQDFGYTNDPSAGVKIARVGDSIFLHEFCYEPGIAAKGLIQLYKANGFTSNNTMYCEHDPDMISQLRRLGQPVTMARKGPGSIKAGIAKMNEYNVFYTASSKNIATEKSKYMWKLDESGKPTNDPIDDFNHCFVGETLITTSRGSVRIDRIKPGDMVLTRKGFKPVVKVFDNGLKPTFNYSMQFDTFSISLTSTVDHKVKTRIGWKQISKLQQGKTVYLCNTSPENNTHFIQEKDIFQEEIKECTGLFTNQSTARLKKENTFIIRTVIRGITNQIISNWYTRIHIFLSTQKAGSKTKNSLKTSKERALNQQKNGIQVKKEKSGIPNMAAIHGTTDHIKQSNVRNAGKIIKPDMQENQNFAITTARLKHFAAESNSIERVYDIMVEGQHEYFANGVLVHNCMDAARYGVYTRFFRA